MEWSVVCRASQGMEVELPIRWMCARQEDVLGGREAFRVEPGAEAPWEQAGLGPQGCGSGNWVVDGSFSLGEGTA